MSDMAMKYEDWLRGCVHHDGRKGNVYLPCDRVLAIADWIEAHRDVAPVRHGRWIEGKLPMYRWGGEKIGEKSTWKCSVCHDVGFWGYYYCPNCGARMDGDADD